MVVLCVVYTIRAGHEAEAELHLRILTECTRLEPGNRAYRVYRTRHQARAYLIYEEYDDDAALVAHRKTPHFEAHGTNGLQRIMERRDAAEYEPLL